ncbi:four-carbon acid sugar kinase family protein [Frondihabitans australicus]|uniref:four-carbon acid sugar kinase family protein n=1 Tax=Frondihabitans australicus TaxID=386892 RepID=UPI0014752C05|nr:four-carbon acid sugar kinase family protein [Frondihabitans australicus]
MVADDVTGALDSAVGFAGAGVVEYGVTAPASADVAAVSTGSRAMASPPVALPAGVDPARFERLYIKIDSTLRGWPREHVEAVMTHWHPGSTAIICPAAPALGRIVRNGRVYVDDEPASLSAAGRDPISPARADLLTDLFGAALIPVSALPGAIGRVPAVVVDAATDADLDAIAAIVATAGPKAVAVGSAGLSAALGRTFPRRPSRLGRVEDVMLVVTSVHPVTRVQVSELDPGALVVLPPQLDDERITHDDALRTARSTATRGAELLRSKPGAAVIVVGGDGTDSFLSAVGAEGIIVNGALLPGVPFGRVRGGPAEGTIIVTKSGGFGTPDTLNDLIHILTEETPK